MSHISRYRYVAAACLVFIVSSATLFFSLKFHTPEHIVFGSSDSQEYQSLANTMLDEQRFALNATALPEVFRTPGYPIFLATILNSFSPIVVSFVQICLVALSAVLTMRIGERFFSRSVGFVAAILFALEPGVIAFGLVGLSDTLFVFLFLMSTWLLLSAESLSPKIGYGALILGASILVRPIALYVAPLFVLWLIWTYRQNIRDMCIAVLVFIFGVSCVVMPWLIRNHMVGGNFTLSTVSAYNLLLFNIPAYESHRDQVPIGKVLADIYKELGTSDGALLRSATYEQQELAIAREHLSGHIFDYAVFHIQKTAPFFLGSGTEAARAILDLGASPDINISNLLLRGNIGAAFAALAASPIAFIEVLIWASICLLAFGAVVISYIYRCAWLTITLFMFSVIIAFAILTGPVSYARYRLPAEPFLFLLATYSLTQIYRGIRRKIRIL